MKTKRGGSGGRVETEFMKQYPWCKTFDDESRATLLNGDVTSSKVLSLITVLESHISSEVSKLKNRPNRATKFLKLIRKRISMLKIAGQMIDNASELVLFPTYGLLMTHFVNIVLYTSEVEKLGAQAVAADIYSTLRLIFSEDPEFVLDVVLCSNLDEQASSPTEVGYQVFSNIVRDFNFCFDSNRSAIMKYCAVASLLADSSKEGGRFVRKSLPTGISEGLSSYLVKNKVLDVHEWKSSYEMVTLMKARRVIAISRNRLIVIAPSQCLKRQVPNTDDSDKESTTSTVVNIPTSSTKDKPSLSTSTGPKYEVDPIHQILDDLKLGGSSGGFYLDTSGGTEDNSQIHTLYEPGDMGISQSLVMEWSKGGSDAAVTSSTLGTAVSGSSSYSKADSCDSGSSDNDNAIVKATPPTRCYSKPQSKPIYKKPFSKFTYSFPTKSSRGDKSDQLDSMDETEEETATRESVGKKLKEELAVEYDSDTCEPPEALGLQICTDEDDSDDELPRVTRRKSKRVVYDMEDSDSDLEVLTVKKAIEVDSDEPSNASSKDEAEPESGEDVVPNYDVDSDEEGLQQSVNAFGKSDGASAIKSNNNNNKKSPETTIEIEAVEIDDGGRAKPSEGKQSPIRNDDEATEEASFGASVTSTTTIEEESIQISSNKSSRRSKSPEKDRQSLSRSSENSSKNSRRVTGVQLGVRGKGERKPKMGKSDDDDQFVGSTSPPKRQKLNQEENSESTSGQESQVISSQDSQSVVGRNLRTRTIVTPLVAPRRSTRTSAITGGADGRQEKAKHLTPASRSTKETSGKGRTLRKC